MSIASRANALLDPVLFQVVGSTPDGLRDSLKKAKLRAERDLGILLAVVCVFAAAVNKATMESYVAQPEFSDLRPLLGSVFAIQNRINMTALTLLGHCFLTAGALDDVTFVKEFRLKMGQRNIWDGNLESGNLGEKQLKILKEKARVTPSEKARLLGVGFFKYVGLDATPMTPSEASFWGEASAASPSRSIAPPSPPRATTTEGYKVYLSNGSVATVPTYLADYYMRVNNTDESGLAKSVEGRGVDNWIAIYTNVQRQNPDGNRTGSTVVG